MTKAHSAYLDLIQRAYDASNDIYFECGEGCMGFRGTEDRADLIADLGVAKVPYDLQMGPYSLPVGQVHAGFLRRWQVIKPLIFAKYGPPVAPGSVITITGHSLGGAVAVLCAIEMKMVGWEVELITYGCPRVGDWQFARLLNQNLKAYTRYENWGDPVPRLPSRFRWKHGGKCNSLGSVWNLFRLPWHKHHFMSAYRAALEAVK